jgi:acyl-CoA thioester hydrolase
MAAEATYRGTVYPWLRNAETDEVAAICEITGVHMEHHVRKATPFPDRIRGAALDDLAATECEIA